MTAVASAVVALTGCNSLNSGKYASSPYSSYSQPIQLPKLNVNQSSGNISGSTSVFSATYNQDPVHPKTRFFLIAAGADIANFIQEVVDQKSYWLDQGFTEDEIACYYVQPTARALEKDREQFEALAPEVAGFRLASMRQISSDLNQIALQNPDFIYIYITSHGAPPSYARSLAKRYAGSGKYAYKSFIEEFPETEQFTVQFHSLPTGSADVLMQLHAQQKGMPFNDIHLSPAGLWNLLGNFNASTIKFVTLQACYSGGFVDAKGRLKFHTAPEMGPPNLTVMTAARYDRPSFGCSPGKEKTEFGSAYMKALHSGSGSPVLRDWKQIFDEVRQEVERVEQLEEYSEFKPSHPAFYSNWLQWE